MNLHLESFEKKIINILYIDDNLDSYITDYLCEEYQYSGIEIKYDEINFDPNSSYEKLLNNQKVHKANIIIIDSALFQESNIINLFTGEEFKIILKKYFPYIEVIIISQNKDDKQYGIVEKFKQSKSGTEQFSEYYRKNLKPLLDESIKNILSLRNILEKLNKNKSLDKILKEKIENSMSGIIEYDELNSSDINNLIEAFKELEKKYK